MVLKNPPLESDGPDRFKNTSICTDHQDGVTTGFSDYCCCCNPCLYRTTNGISASGMEHCCRCYPRIVVFKYTPNNAHECCRPAASPALAEIVPIPAGYYIKYSSSVAGYAINLYLSTGTIIESIDGPYAAYDEDPYGENCTWTVQIAELGVLEEITIDHVDITCNGVPSISVENVPGFNGCLGTISLANFPAEKVPFVLREFPETFPDGHDQLIPLNYPCQSCDEVPRFLCVSGIRHPGEASEFAEFVWEIGYTPVDMGDDGFAIGRWRLVKPGVSGLPDTYEYIYLIEYPTEGFYENSIGYVACKLKTDFESPGTTPIFDNELFEDIFLDEAGCACGMNFTLNKASHITDPKIIISAKIRTGRCGCYQHVCGSCRCVSQYLCGFVFYNNVVYNNVLYTWDVSIKGWVASGGEDANGNSLPIAVSILLQSNEIGECEATADVSASGYTFTASSIECGLIMGISVEGISSDNLNSIYVFGSTSLTGECNDLITCSDASPCADACGTHPALLNAFLNAWNDPYLDEPGITGSCEMDVELHYWQQIFPTSATTIELLCGYTGFKTVTCYDNILMQNYSARFRFDLSQGQLSIEYWDLRGSEPNASTIKVLDYEICDPYIGEYFEVTGLNDCLWGCPGTQQTQRLEIEIIEA